MPKYLVTLREVVLYQIPCIAESEEDAEAAAEEAFVQSKDPQREYFISVEERDAVKITEEQ